MKNISFITSIKIKALILIFALPVSVSCQNEDSKENFHPASSSDEYVYSMEITVKSQSPSSPHSITEIPAFVTTLHINDNIARFQDLSSVLEGSTGVNISDFGGLGHLSTVSIRGSSANQVLVLLNGVKLNSGSGSAVDLSSIAIQNIEKVEILRGADSAVYGNGAFAGVVNIITRSTTSTKTGVNTSMTFGSYKTFMSSFGLSSHFKSLHYQLLGHYNRGDGDFTFTNDNGTEFSSDDDFTDVRKNNEFNNTGLLASWSAPAGSYQNLSGHVEASVIEEGSPGLITFPSLHAQQKQTRLTANVHYENLAFSSFFDRILVDAASRLGSLSFEDPEGEQMGVPVDTRQNDSLLSSCFRLEQSFGAFFFSSAIEVQYESLHDEQFDRQSRTTLSGIFKSQVSLFSNKSTVSLLVRYDDTTDSSRHLNPKMGLTFHLTDHFSLKANTGTGFRLPSFNELYMNLGYMTGNPDLSPEESNSYDLGISAFFEKFQCEVAAFQTDSEDLIQYMLISGFRYKPMNIGKVRSRGIELDASFSILHDLTLSLSNTYLEAVDRTGNSSVRNKQIPGKPRNEFFAKLNWDSGTAASFIEWNYIGRNSITQSNTKWLPEREIFNSGFSWKFHPYFMAGLEIKNLTDDRVVDIRGFPLPPRTYLVSLKFSY